jgi:hypothetical protein
LPLNSGARIVNPVAFPPGRARLSTTPDTDRVSNDSHNDWNRFSRLLGGSGGRSSVCDDHIDVELDELRRELGKSLDFFFGPTPFDRDGFALEVAELAETLQEGLGTERERGRRAGKEHTDPRNFATFLRPGDRRAHYDYETNNAR